MNKREIKRREKAQERARHRAGFRHVAGWVREEDVAAIMERIDKVRDEVEAVKEGME